MNQKRPEDVSEVEHGPKTACYSNLPYQHPVIFCLCGEYLEGDTWEDVGAAFDEHLAETEKTDAD
jgi:hypothetical protein